MGLTELYERLVGPYRLSMFGGQKGLCAVHAGLLRHTWRCFEHRVDPRTASRGWRPRSGLPFEGANNPGQLVLDRRVIDDLVRGGYDFDPRQGDPRLGDDDSYSLVTVEEALCMGAFFESDVTEEEVVTIYGNAAWQQHLFNFIVHPPLPSRIRRSFQGPRGIPAGLHGRPQRWGYH